MRVDRVLVRNVADVRKREAIVTWKLQGAQITDTVNCRPTVRDFLGESTGTNERFPLCMRALSAAGILNGWGHYWRRRTIGSFKMAHARAAEASS